MPVPTLYLAAFRSYCTTEEHVILIYAVWASSSAVPVQYLYVLCQLSIFMSAQKPRRLPRTQFVDSRDSSSLSMRTRLETAR
jgi:hypothetical protein